MFKKHLSNSVPTNNILISPDAVPCMFKAGHYIEMFDENLIHMICLAHGLNKNAESIKASFPEFKELVVNVK